jgi:hypothetical protein
MAHPAEGRAPHARKEGITQTTTLPRFGHGPFADPEVAMTCPGLSPARICGRAERVPPRKSPFARSAGFRREALLPWMALPSEGRAPAARKGRHRGEDNIIPFWPPTPRQLVFNHDLPRFTFGLASRTRRARLSEKTAFRVISGPAAQGHLPLDRTPLRWGLKRPHKRW